MTNRIKVFDQLIIREIDQKRMWLPGPESRSQFVIQNHDFREIEATWDEVGDAIDFEDELLQRLESAENPRKCYEEIWDELYEDMTPVQDLDVGVASVVFALTALGCITTYSCNGGAFSDGHHAEFPLVVFYSAPKNAKTLLAAAEAAGVAIGHEDEGALMVWANEIRRMHTFACKLKEMRPKKRRSG